MTAAGPSSGELRHEARRPGAKPEQPVTPRELDGAAIACRAALLRATRSFRRTADRYERRPTLAAGPAS